MTRFLRVWGDEEFAVCEFDDFLDKHSLSYKDVYEIIDGSVINKKILKLIKQAEKEQVFYVKCKKFDCDISKECFEYIENILGDYDAMKQETVYLVDE